MRPSLFAPLTAMSCAAVLLAHSAPASACGGCFHGPTVSTTPSVVTGHRMALSISETRTVLWDQVQYAGDPKDFAWVLPVGPGAYIEEASPAWFEALEAVTGTRVVSPLVTCQSGQMFQSTEGGSGFGCGASGAASRAFVDPSESDEKMQEGTDGNVTVVHEGAVGAYETVTLKSDDAMALHDWLVNHGYQIPADIEPVIAYYVQQHSEFIALRLQPDAGVRQMTPVRVITPGASPTLPLRMVAAGTGENVSIVLYLIGEGRYETSNFPIAQLDDKALAWDWSSSDSNYSSLRQTALTGGGFLSTFAFPRAFTARIRQTDGTAATYTATGSFQVSDTLADLYFSQAAADEGMLDECPGMSQLIDDIPEGARVVEPERLPDGSSLLGATRDLPADRLACNGFSDVGTALTGMHPHDVWVTRLEANLPRSSLDRDLTLGATMTQSPIPNWHQATKNIGSPCPGQAVSALEKTSNAGCTMRRPRFHDGAALGLAVMALGLAARRASRRRR